MYCILPFLCIRIRCEEKDRNVGQQLERRRNRLSCLLSDEFQHYERELEVGSTPKSDR